MGPTETKILAKIRQQGHKLTPQRRAVLHAIAHTQNPLTPNEVYLRVRQKNPSIGLVTIYRTLSVLAKLDLICEVHTGENARGYVGSPLEHHGHLICSECGKVIDFTGCNFGTLEQRLSSETGFIIKEHILEFHGRCQACQLKTAV
ncbi:Fur family transcriptional regulator [Chloroflexota bacterium]